jgi:hypothetical protein
MATIGHSMRCPNSNSSPLLLSSAADLCGATLSDGTKLSEDNWEAKFESGTRSRKPSRTITAETTGGTTTRTTRTMTDDLNPTEWITCSPGRY